MIVPFPIEFLHATLSDEDAVQLPFSFALAANEIGHNPLSGWAYEFPPFNGIATVFARTTGAARTVNQTVKVGATEAVPRSPVQVGGTSGVTPVANTTPGVQFAFYAGQRLALLYDELAGATPVVDGLIQLNPA